MPNLARFKPARLAAVLCLLVVSSAIAGNLDAADLHAVTDDGRKVLLREDGGWEFTQPGLAEPDTGSIQLSLDKVVIQTRTVKVQKNIRLRSQTVFEFNLVQPAGADSRLLAEKLDASLVTVIDDTGKVYELKSMQLDPAIVQPGEAARLRIKVDKSPGLLSQAKYVEVVFQAALFDSGQAMRIQIPVDDIETVEVDDF